MLVSTKGRYALRVLIDLAEHQTTGYIPLKEIAQRQEVSEKYLESIIKILVKDGVLTGLRGKGGGYRLTVDPSQYTLKELLLLTEGTLSPVSCLDDHTPCPHEDCRIDAMWEQLDGTIKNFLDSVTIADLVPEAAPGSNYVI
ncbi:Rrf2 family transcriptional regulator [Arcanobacterium haemolyticum]|nr:Rrf2 family transcriptional regulator [Arcanobacterium haemolyticum]